jgi:hypothetical protein
LMLLLVRELLGATPPENIMLEMKPDDYRASALEEALDQFIDVSPAGQLTGRRISGLLAIKTAKGIRLKLLAIIRTAFPPRVNMALIYPVSASSPKILFCYMLRLGRIMAHLARVLLRLMRRDRSVMKDVHQAIRVSAVSDWMFS